MALDLRDCQFLGPGLPEPFVQHELERELQKRGLLRRAVGEEGEALRRSWDVVRRRLRDLGTRGYAQRVWNHVVAPVAEAAGYAPGADDAGVVETREGREDGGRLLAAVAAGGAPARLRAFSTDFEEDLDAPARRGQAYRYSAIRAALRVLGAVREPVALLTNGVELRLLYTDGIRPETHVVVAIDPEWKRRREPPDSFRLVLALASPAGVRALPEIVEAARLQQTRVTTELRKQARTAAERFIQGLLDEPANRDALVAAAPDRDALARALWREALIVIYRLLFILKLETFDDPARAFSFASVSIWRNTYSPATALARAARRLLDDGADTGRYLEDGLRALFRLFVEGIETSELRVRPLGGALFGPEATPVLSTLPRFGERAVADLLDCLLWTPARRGAAQGRERVHYGPLNVEDLGRVYEALLELEPGIAGEPMCRLRRQKLEVVVPLAQGERYRVSAETPAPTGSAPEPDGGESETEADGGEDEDAPDDAPARGRKTRVEWIQEIRPGAFYLRVGLGRKATGSYYTPDTFVRFLIEETLGPLVAERSPEDDPQPARILELRVLDPAMGSGHFLIGACRYLGARLHEAAARCDERAEQAERHAERAKDDVERHAAEDGVRRWRSRIEDLPDPDGLLALYLPSRAAGGSEAGVSRWRAEAICRRLVAVHCLYGVDKNPLAVELAKLSLWIESHAEGLPLTFLDHRFPVGDSLTGPLFRHLATQPSDQEPIHDLFAERLRERLDVALATALREVAELEATIGATTAATVAKVEAKARLDHGLAPFRLLAAAWAGGVMLGEKRCDDAGYIAVAGEVARTGAAPAESEIESDRLSAMIERGRDALPFDLTFPEVFFPGGRVAAGAGGFDAVMGNPPWDAIQPLAKEFFAAFDLRVLDAPTRRERAAVEQRLTADPVVAGEYQGYIDAFDAAKQTIDALYEHVNRSAGGAPSGAVTDIWQAFAERAMQIVALARPVGLVLPSAFHANQSATGIRDLYLERSALRACYSFENRRKLFEIDSRFKFALVVASRGGRTEAFPCAFYLHDDEWLATRTDPPPLKYARAFVERTGGAYFTLLELRAPADVGLAKMCYASGEAFGERCERSGIRLGRELHMTDDARRFTPADGLVGPGDPREPEHALSVRARGYAPLHEGKTFHQYDDRWEAPPRYLVALGAVADKPAWLRAARHYRLAFRDIASSTNERTGIFALLPPGVLCGNTAPCEREPESRATSGALLLLALANAYSFDWTLRQKSAAHVNLFILDGCPVPKLDRPRLAPFLAHSALRLTCNHAGYAPLWREQVGDLWREPSPPHTWPVLAGDDARWAVRAAIDAVVADAYGLSREQYAHVLSTFSHRSYPRAPERCLAAFDELKAIGLEAFARKNDPYFDVSLVETLPEPVIELPVPGAGEALPAPAGGAGATAPTSPSRPVRRGGRGREAAPEEALPLFRDVSAETRPASPTLPTAAGPSGAPAAAVIAAARATQPGAPDAAPPPPESDDFARLLALLRERETIASEDVQRLLGRDAAGVRPLLKRLVRDGHAVKEGERRGTRYRRRGGA